MGMFDTVWLMCPKCDERIEAQSKAGACTLADFDQDSVPLAIAEDIKNDDLWCSNCAISYRAVALDPPPDVVAMRLVRQ